MSPGGLGGMRSMLDLDAAFADAERMSEDVRSTAAEVASSLRAVVAAVDAGELDAEAVQRAYLAAAAEALETVATRATTSDLR